MSIDGSNLPQNLIFVSSKPPHDLIPLNTIHDLTTPFSQLVAH